MNIDFVGAMDLICRYCGKFMGNICVDGKDNPDWQLTTAKMIEYLNRIHSWPVCDVCCATKGYKLGKTLFGDAIRNKKKK